MLNWFHNIFQAVSTVASGLFVTLRYWFATYRDDRGTFTEKFEYPELPVPVAPRYRGFHRFDLTTCIACDQCAKVCPVDCIYIGKERVEGGKGFRVTGFTIDYSKCMFCALCCDPCPTDCIHMGNLHDLSGFDRESMIVEFTDLAKEGLQTPMPVWMRKDRIPAWAQTRKDEWLQRGEPLQEEMVKALSEQKPPKKPKAV